MKGHFKTYSELNTDTVNCCDTLTLLQPFEISSLTKPRM